MGLPPDQIVLITVIAGLIAIGIMLAGVSYISSLRHAQSYTVHLNVLPADLHVDTLVALTVQQLHTDPMFNFIALGSPPSASESESFPSHPRQAGTESTRIPTHKSIGSMRSSVHCHPMDTLTRLRDGPRQHSLEAAGWEALIQANVEAQINMAEIRVVSNGTASGSSLVAAFMLSYLSSSPGCASPLAHMPLARRALNPTTATALRGYDVRAHEVSLFPLPTCITAGTLEGRCVAVPFSACTILIAYLRALPPHAPP